MDKRQITKLWKKLNTLGVIYEVKDGKVIERKLGDDDGDRVSREIWQDEKLDNGCWRFCVFYADKLLEHFTDFIGVDNNNKLINGKLKGGFYLGGYKPYHGDFYIDKKSAEKVVKPIDTKALIVAKINKIKDYAHNCLYSEDIDFFDRITEEILELIQKQ